MQQHEKVPANGYLYRPFAWTTCWRPCSKCKHFRWEWCFWRRFHCSLLGYGLGFQVSAGCDRIFHALWLQNTFTKFWYCFWVSVWNWQNVWKLPSELRWTKIAHVHRELNSTYSSTWSASQCTPAPWAQFNLLLNMRQLYERKFKENANIFSTAPEVLSIILWSMWWRLKKTWSVSFQTRRWSWKAGKDRSAICWKALWFTWVKAAVVDITFHIPATNTVKWYTMTAMFTAFYGIPAKRIFPQVDSCSFT